MRLISGICATFTNREQFRQDLISEAKAPSHRHHRHEGYSVDADNIVHFENHLQLPGGKNKRTKPSKPEPPKADFEMVERYRRPSLAAQARTGELHRQRMRSTSPSRSLGRIEESDAGSSKAPSESQISLQLPDHFDDDEDADEEKAQDVQEIWFPGCHAVSNSLFFVIPISQPPEFLSTGLPTVLCLEKEICKITVHLIWQELRGVAELMNK